MTAETLRTLANGFGLRLAGEKDGEPPAFFNSADFQTKESYKALKGVGEPPENLDVESSLSALISRLNTCVAYRDKLHELQRSALADAWEVISQQEIVKSQLKLYRILHPAPDGTSGAADLESKNITDQLDAFGALRREEAARPGSAIAYVERFTQTHALFTSNFRKAYGRAKQISKLLDSIYGIPETLPEPDEEGYLNVLITWAQEAANLLEEAQDKRIVTPITFALSSRSAKDIAGVPFNEGAFLNALKASSLIFKIPNASFEDRRLYKPLIRSFALQIVSDNAELASRIYRFSVQTPNNLNVMYVQGVVQKDPNVQRFVYKEGFHNRNPAGGDWTIKLESQSSVEVLLPDAYDNFKNILLHLTVSHEHKA